MDHLPWLCIGDFNEILSDNEKVSGSARNRSLMERFQEALNLCGLEGMGFLGPTYTWCNKCDEHRALLLATTGQAKRARFERHFYFENCIKEIETQLDDLLACEEVYWKQMACVELFNEGNRNTRFFHMKASERKARNRIQGLFDNSGMWRSESKDLANVVISYFSNLFVRFSLRIFRWIRAAAFAIAPRFDGQLGMFYLNFWDTIGPSVVSACLRCLNNGDPLDAVNNTLVFLIPKVKNAERMNEFDQSVYVL
ncbi:hypothetical protein Dsin_022414 [Dipteronia sinensis]|uniref:Reverse transcriptase n=1 Tax=Dipteronia sinensis TaxID=43782 RepID=A0AAE0E015_9ROSI|nr:hypothetical protein Dsin_022414 [Dipteronia sinensis]